MVLVFLPGTREIEDVRAAILGRLASREGRVRREWVLPLHPNPNPDPNPYPNPNPTLTLTLTQP